MHRLTQLTLLLVISTFLLAANPFQEPPPATPTSAPFDTCLTEGFPECIPNVLRAYGLWAVLLLGIFAVAFIFLRVEIQNWVAGWKKLRKKDADEVFTRLEVDEVTRDYLKKVIEDYRYFKFRGLDTRSRGIDTPELDQAYISIQMVPEAEKRIIHEGKEGIEITGIDLDGDYEQNGPGAVHKVIESDAPAPLSLVEAIRLTPRLAVVGGAGSGKSTLLQWAGLACARAVVEPGKLTPEQGTFTKAAGDKPLLPILIPLRDFNRDCMDTKKNRTARTLLDFITASIVEKHPALKLPPDFFEIHLRQKGCLVMFDGVDEVDPDDRERIREAIEALVAEFKDNPRNRYLVTSRTMAYFGAAEVSGFRKCLVQNLTPDQRDLLIRNWCLAAYGGDEAANQAGDLCHRINISDERVQALAITPLMVTIFALVHYDRRELPRQRAELYEHAVRIILTEPYKEGEAAAELKRDWETRRAGGLPGIRAVRRDRIAVADQVRRHIVRGIRELGLDPGDERLGLVHRKDRRQRGNEARVRDAQLDAGFLGGDGVAGHDTISGNYGMLSIHEINQLGKMVEDGKLGDLGLLRLAKSTLQGRKKGDTRSIP